MPGEGTVLEPLSRIIGMKYVGTVSVPTYFQGRVAFCNAPFDLLSKLLIERRIECVEIAAVEAVGRDSQPFANLTKSKYL